jgi:hypothetical protein
MEISIGEFTLPAILTIVMMIVYKVIPTFPDRWKALMTIAVGIALGLVAMIYTGMAVTFQIVVNYVLAGLFAGAAAVGLYEAQDKVRGSTSTLKVSVDPTYLSKLETATVEKENKK